MEERSIRITSSNFGTICKTTEQRDLHKFAAQLVSPKEFQSSATTHGKKYEAVAVEKFEKMYAPTTKCGLFVHESCSWLAASPDSL